MESVRHDFFFCDKNHRANTVKSLTFRQKIIIISLNCFVGSFRERWLSVMRHSPLNNSIAETNIIKHDKEHPKG